MNVLIPEYVVIAFFLQPVRLNSMEKKSPEIRIHNFDITWNKNTNFVIPYMTGYTLLNSLVKHCVKTAFLDFENLAGSNPAMIPPSTFFFSAAGLEGEKVKKQK